MLVEINHKYLDEPIGFEDSYNLNLLQSLITNKSVRDILILIDDIHIENKLLDVNELKKMYEDVFINSNVHLIYESELVSICDTLYTQYFSKLIKVESFKKENKYVEFIYLKDKKIPIRYIKPSNTDYTCVFYSLALAFYKYSNFNSYGVTILNECFKDVELKVIKLAEMIDLSINEKDNYYFYNL